MPDRDRLTFGMLWADMDPDISLEEKLRKALRYYSEKYGKQANRAVVNLDQLEDVEIEGLTVDGSIAVQPDHLWVGVHEGD